MGSPFQVADCLFDVALVLVLGQLQEQALFRRSRIPRVKDLLSQGLSPPESCRVPVLLSQPSLQAEPPSPWAWPVSPALEPASVVCLRARVLIHGPLEQNQDLVVELGLAGGGAAAPAAAASAAATFAAASAPAAATAWRAGLPPPPRPRPVPRAIGQQGLVVAVVDFCYHGSRRRVIVWQDTVAW